MGRNSAVWLPRRVLHSTRFDCGSTGLWVLQMGTVGYCGYCGYCAVPTVPVVTARYCGYCGYCMGKSDSWVLRQYPWVLQGTMGTVGTVTVGYPGYCRWVLQGTVERIECSSRECCTQH
jgi:hypothetical protein